MQVICLIWSDLGGKVLDNFSPSLPDRGPTGIWNLAHTVSDPRAEISGILVMVRCSSTTSRGTTSWFLVLFFPVPGINLRMRKFFERKCKFERMRKFFKKKCDKGNEETASSIPCSSRLILSEKKATMSLNSQSAWVLRRLRRDCTQKLKQGHKQPWNALKCTGNQRG